MIKVASLSLLSLLSFLSLLFVAPATVATPVEAQRYEFTITLSCFYDFSGGGCSDTHSPRGDTVLGKPYQGTFAIDAGLLATDGWTATTPLEFFFSTGYTIFDPRLPSGRLDDHFNGFLNYWGRPQTLDVDPDFNAVGHWGIEIRNNQLMQFCCYVFGDADAFGVDFNFSDMSALVRGYGGPHSQDYYMAGGAFAFQPIPEPNSVLLALLAIVMLAVTRLRETASATIRRPHRMAQRLGVREARLHRDLRPTINPPALT